ncbi:GntR family transcriptional regulator [Calothrix sp. CCY 0018]|uniref:GntR family transcriptional regulator n=1 Tax=Calothrix sp. CCY 0018 TaxID=3103864 RepID=UPI0039C6445E
MKIPLDRKSRKPIYLQIKDRITRLIKSGALQPEERLPSIRSLAENLQGKILKEHFSAKLCANLGETLR